MIQLTDSPSSHGEPITFSFAGQQYRTTRIIGEFGDHSGPTFVFIGGIHGNEPTGVIAIQQVLSELEATGIPIKGRVIGLVGNMRSLEKNARYVTSDLNRIWNQGFLERWKQRRQKGVSSETVVDEDREQIELFAELEPLIHDCCLRRQQDRSSQLFFADLHTTSSRSIPFIGVNDQLANRDFALKFPAPIVLGIEEYLEGPLLSMLNNEGHVAVAFEAGQHDDPQSLENHKSFIYLALVNAGLIDPKHAEPLQNHHQRLADVVPPENRGILEVVHRHAVKPDDQFTMKPGFKNLANISEGEELAHDRTGPILSPRSGRIFMPLYQPTGNDGFFVVRSVPGWALLLSRFLRRINFEKALVLLPGVSRSDSQTDALVVDKRVAKYLATELFHLLGYRRKQQDGDRMIFSRREIQKTG